MYGIFLAVFTYKHLVAMWSMILYIVGRRNKGTCNTMKWIFTNIKWNGNIPIKDMNVLINSLYSN